MEDWDCPNVQLLEIKSLLLLYYYYYTIGQSCLAYQDSIVFGKYLVIYPVMSAVNILKTDILVLLHVITLYKLHFPTK